MRNKKTYAMYSKKKKNSIWETSQKKLDKSYKELRMEEAKQPGSKKVKKVSSKVEKYKKLVGKKKKFRGRSLPTSGLPEEKNPRY